jgi:hypothetical protein
MLTNLSPDRQHRSTVHTPEFARARLHLHCMLSFHQSSSNHIRRQSDHRPAAAKLCSCARRPRRQMRRGYDVSRHMRESFAAGSMMASRGLSHRSSPNSCVLFWAHVAISIKITYSHHLNRHLIDILNNASETSLERLTSAFGKHPTIR